MFNYSVLQDCQVIHSYIHYEENIYKLMNRVYHIQFNHMQSTTYSLGTYQQSIQNSKGVNSITCFFTQSYRQKQTQKYCLFLHFYHLQYCSPSIIPIFYQCNFSVQYALSSMTAFAYLRSLTLQYIIVIVCSLIFPSLFFKLHRKS